MAHHQADRVTQTAPVEGIVYGPVHSRRLGLSLGVNILPSGIKVCSFNCGYCQLGWSREPADPASRGRHSWPSPGEVAAEVGRRVCELAQLGVRLDCLTFSGNGEPTLHPDFPAVVREVLAVRDRSDPGVRVDILTNGSTLADPRVVDGLNLLDERYVKLDAGTDEGLHAMNSPEAGLRVEDVLRGMRSLKDAVIQTMFTQGRRNNSSDADVDRWVDAVGRANPKAVHIYSLDRRPADGGLLGVDRARLEEIAARLLDRTGIRARVF